MSGSTFQPPIHLDPTQGSDQQTAFINQNFQAIASTLETNSFRIVQQALVSLSNSGNTTSVLKIPHNLGFAPVPFVYLANQTRTLGTLTITNANIPLPTYGLALNSDTTNHIVSFEVYMDCIADAQNLYIFMTNSTATATNFSFQYYLVQQPSS